MTRIIGARLASSIATIFGASILAFVLLRKLPGDPARLAAGDLASPEAVEQIRSDMGLNDSLPAQYVAYIRQFFSGDWGFSYANGQPVSTLIADRVPATIELALVAITFAVVGAVFFAVAATYRRSRALDTGVRVVSSIGLGTPPFWFGFVALLLLSQELHLFPGPEGRLSTEADPPPHATGLYTVDAVLAGDPGSLVDAVHHLILPAAAVALASFAFLVRLLRASLRDASREPYVLVARSKGLGRRESFSRHVFPNSILPTLTAGGLIFAEMLVGTVLAEKVFNWPGTGSLLIDSVTRKDFAVVQALIFLSAITYVLINLAVDVLYGLVDPRIRSGSGASVQA